MAGLGSLLLARVVKRKWDHKQALKYKSFHGKRSADEHEPIVSDGAAGGGAPISSSAAMTLAPNPNNYDAGTV